MFHILSDLKLKLHDYAEDQHLLDHSVKYIVLTGNIADTNKRSMLFAEALADLHPRAHIIYNYGLLESYQGEWGKIVEGYDLYIKDFKKSKKNLYLPKGDVIGDYDFYCTVGWPTFFSSKNYKDSFIGSQILENYSDEFYIDDILMTSKFPKNLSLEYIKQKSKTEEEELKSWIKKDQGRKKVLISSFGDNSNSYMKNLEFKIFPNLDLNNIIWICGGDYEIFDKNNSNLTICLPGLNRHRYLLEPDFKLIYAKAQ